MTIAKITIAMLAAVAGLLLGGAYVGRATAPSPPPHKLPAYGPAVASGIDLYVALESKGLEVDAIDPKTVVADDYLRRSTIVFRVTIWDGSQALFRVHLTEHGVSIKPLTAWTSPPVN